MGYALFVGAQVAGPRIEPVIAKLWPYLVGLILALLIVVFVPQISLWRPTSLGLLSTS